jgi:uncharacterized iron-regulated protein
MELTEQQLQEKIDEAVRGLKDKNAELLGKITTYKKTFDKLEGVDI